jgi:hypothetical protein
VGSGLQSRRPTSQPGRVAICRKIYRLSTPAGKNDLRICIANSAPFDLPLPRSFCVGSKEHGFVTAGELYGLTYPSDASDEQFVPFFEIDTRSRFFITAQIPELSVELGRQLLGFGMASDRASDQ